MHEVKNKFSSVEIVKIEIAEPDAWGGRGQNTQVFATTILPNCAGT